MKRILTPLLWLGMCAAATAAPVSADRASRVASALLQARVQQASLPASVSNLYLFVADGRFAVVAADDCVRPVLAYGDLWTTDSSLPAHIEDWLKAYGEEIALLSSQKTVASESTAAEWQQLEGGDPLYSVVVSPLLTTTWNQSPRYNNLCPANCVTGCVATATAQLMKYWNHPQQGTGSHSYSDGNHGLLSANFGATTYQWSSMPNALTSSSSSTAINAVATLMYHVGVAVEMTYGSSSSASTGSYGNPASACAENALKTYFGYSHSASHVFKDALSDSVWCALLDAELAAARPILYSGRDPGGGHAFVLDGSNNAGHYHVNWGWGGYCDGYYLMGQLNPTAGGTGGSASSTYNLANSAVLGLRPASATMPANCPVQVSINDPSNAYVTGAAGSHAPLDTVSLRVNTSDGYRFVRWSDGIIFNPRRQVLDTALSLAAVVEPISLTDTVYYAGNAHFSSYGYPSGNGCHWGMKLFPADLQRFRTLDAVQFYASSSGTYVVRIASGGGNTPSYFFHIQTVNVADGDRWVTVQLDSALTIDATLPLWVTMFSGSVTYPAASTHYAGNGNGSWMASGSGNGSNWHMFTDVSFMVRAIFSSAVQCTLTADGGEHGTVSGSGIYNAGTTVSLLAEPATCYAFVGWSDGNTDNPRSVSVLSDTAFHALFQESTLRQTLEIQACDSFYWNGSTYRASIVDSLSTTSVEGCDSVCVLQLTVNATAHTEVHDTATGSYSWHGHNYTESGDYQYVGTTGAGCDSIVTLHLVVLGGQQGIGEADAAAVSLYPNPAASALTVDGVPLGALVTVCDLSGREHLRLTARAERLTLPVAALPAGTYLLSVGRHTYRFLKQ